MAFGDNGPRKKSFFERLTVLVVLIMLVVTVGALISYVVRYLQMPLEFTSFFLLEYHNNSNKNPPISQLLDYLRSKEFQK